MKIKHIYKNTLTRIKNAFLLILNGLEGAYSNPSFRGLRIMPQAMSEIAKKVSKEKNQPVKQQIKSLEKV